MSNLSAALTRAWLKRGPLAWALWPLSLLMSLLVALRRLAYRQGWMATQRLDVPVLVVGNRVAGGAGKTPTTIAIVQHLQATGWRPGVLSRGYKAADAAKAHLMLDAATPAHIGSRQTGDEPWLIWRRTQAPVMVGRDRVAGAKALRQAHPDIDILVCDDGLQHLRLWRDIEIVVFDDRGAGNGWLLPAGPLREPAHAPSPPGLAALPIVLYNADRATTALPGHMVRRHLGRFAMLADWWMGRNSSAQLDADQPAWALAGIATPERFFGQLRAQGRLIHPLPLPDHADFTTLPWPPTVKELIVTEKDAVKLDPARIARERPNTRVWVAALDFQPEASFWAALDAALSRLPGPSHPG